MIPRQNNRLYVPINEIDSKDRIRQDFGDMAALKDSLTQHGLLQPIVIDQNKRLIAGGRRLQAHIELGETDICANFYECLSDLQLRILEVEENIVRKDFDWKERILAIAIAHESAKRNAILHSAAKSWTQQQTGELLNLSVGNVNNALKLAALIRSGDTEISKSDNPRAAFDVLLLRKEREAQKRMAEFISGKAQSGTGVTQQEAAKVLAEIEASGQDDFFDEASKITGGSGGVVTAPSTGEEMPGSGPGRLTPPSQRVLIPLSTTVLKGDCIEVMSQMQEASVDHILTDIPYGTDTEMQAQGSAGAGTRESVDSVAAEHVVADNVAMFAPFLKAAYRVVRPQGYCIFWCDIEHWNTLHNLATETGFKVQRWPLVWHKTHSCKNEAAGFNWTKNTEVAMVCRKANAVLITPQVSSVWAGSSDAERAQLQHPYVKPFALWQWVLNAIAPKGATILDPYAGVGSLPLAAIAGGWVPVAIELKEIHYNRLVINVSEAYKKLHSDVEFT